MFNSKMLPIKSVQLHVISAKNLHTKPNWFEALLFELREHY